MAADENISSLKRRVVTGTLWTIFGYGASQVIRLGSSLIMTRLLFPKAYGIMSLVYVVMQGLKMFSDIGIKPALIQHNRGEDPVFINTAWTIQVIRGFGLWLCASILAWPASLWFHEPMLIWCIPVASFSAAISGFNATSLALLNRKLILGRQTLLDLIEQIFTTCVTIALAYYWPSVWALVGGGLVGGVPRAASRRAAWVLAASLRAASARARLRAASA